MAAIIAGGFELHRRRRLPGRVRARPTRRAAAVAALAGVDVLALPTTPSRRRSPTCRPTRSAKNERLGTLTTFANLLGLPVVVVPIGAGAPVGLQLLAARGQDTELLAFAATL